MLRVAAKLPKLPASTSSVSLWPCVPRRALSAAALKSTVLHDTHVALGGKMVPFAGYSMPVQYKDGIKDSHLHVRSAAGLFDVSHMGQIRLHGADRVAFLESLVVADVQAIADGSAGLSLFTTESGGIIDDTIISNAGDTLSLVINAGCKDKDIAHIEEQLKLPKWAGKDVALEVDADQQLLALQGPAAKDVLGKLLPDIDLAEMAFMTHRNVQLLGVDMHLTRCGYTGEDGFEISVPPAKTIELWETITGFPQVRPVGLGARDSLRLEAGLCLYGNDIDTTTSPVEAALTWTIGKRRREHGGFLGDNVILKHLNDGISRRRMAFIMPKGAPARGGEALLDIDTGKIVGKVTSGGFSPSLKCAIGMGYADKPFNKSCTKLQVKVRSKTNDIEVKKMPLVPAQYYTGGK